MTSIITWVSVLSTLISAAEEPVPVGLQKQLLVDDYVIAQKENVIRELGKPEKLGAVMQPSTPTDFHPVKKFPDGLPKTGGYYAFGRRVSVLWNENHQKFQMLYRACGEPFTGYAESQDGIRWSKPFVSQDGNSNLITHRGRNLGTFYEASFMIDPTVPWGHSEKYKAAFNPGNVRCAIAHSPDGIHWENYNGGDSVTGRAADTFNQVLWDPVGKRYMLITRTDLKAKGGRQESRASRIMVHERGNDLAAHPTAWKTLAIVTVDDPEKRMTKAGAVVLQMESMNVWVYENVYFGLMHVLTAGELTGARGRIPVADPHKRPEADVIDYYLGTSRNGKDFDLSWVYAKEPFVPRGPDRSFDKAAVQPSSEIITLGDEHLIYYTGMYHQHHSPASATTEMGKIGLAKLPLDRFICLRAGERVGSITTKPFKLEGNTLEVNVDAKSGWMTIQLLDENHKAITPFSSKHTGVDDMRLTPEWESEDLSHAKGKTVRLMFTLQNAKLYAFRFKE